MKTIFIHLVFYFISLFLTAQVRSDANINLVNQNIWRGQYQAGMSIQPEVNFIRGNWSFQIWGTSDFEGEEREIDLSIGYNLHNFNIGLTDYWFGGITDAYLKNHILESNITYAFTRLHLSLEWNTILTGCDNSYPVFQRISYSPRWHKCEYEFAVGYSPWRNEMLNSNGFAINELSASISKEIGVTRNFRLYCGSSLIYNPYSDHLFFVCKITIPLIFHVRN